jgi:hypothetical protein
MFIERQCQNISKIPKGLYVKKRGKYIQSLRDFGNKLIRCPININSLREY